MSGGGGGTAVDGGFNAPALPPKQPETHRASAPEATMTFTDASLEREQRMRGKNVNSWVFRNPLQRARDVDDVSEDRQLVISHINLTSPRPDARRSTSSLMTFNAPALPPKQPETRRSTSDESEHAHSGVPHGYPQLSTPFTARKPCSDVT